MSLLRSLGIACRPVTCYNSAHLCTKLGQVDRYFSTEGELVEDLSKDQIWYKIHFTSALQTKCMQTLDCWCSYDYKLYCVLYKVVEHIPFWLILYKMHTLHIFLYTLPSQINYPPCSYNYTVGSTTSGVRRG